ncbi:MAG: hypothetical protein AB1646_20655 [Thermodesulfobacteriota bacterium]
MSTPPLDPLDDSVANAAQREEERSLVDNVMDSSAGDAVQAVGEVAAETVTDGVVDAIGDAIVAVAESILDL